MVEMVFVQIAALTFQTAVKHRQSLLKEREMIEKNLKTRTKREVIAIENTTNNLIPSRFMHIMDVGSEYKAIYHALNMETVFVEDKLAKKISTGSLQNIPVQNLENLKTRGLLIEDETEDTKSYKTVKDKLNSLPLTVLYLLVTDKCNFDCRYCFIEGGYTKNQSRNQMSQEIAKRGMDLFVKNIDSGKKRRRTIIFYGGEPILNWNTVEFALGDIASRKEKGSLPTNTRVNLITNGSLITPEIAKVLRKHNVGVSVSLDGRETEHNRNRIFHSSKGTFIETTKGIQILKNHNVHVGISCTLTEGNLETLEEIATFLVNDLDIVSIGFNFLRENPKFSLKDPEYMEKASRAVIESYRILRKKGVYEDRIMRKVNAFTQKKPRINNCAGCGQQIVMAPTGEIGVCHGGIGPKDFFIPYSPDLNTNTHPLWQEWKTRSPFNMEKCTNCIALGICGGGCAYEAFLKHDSIWKLDDPFCIHSKMTLEFLVKDLFEKCLENEKTNRPTLSPSSKH